MLGGLVVLQQRPYTSRRPSKAEGNIPFQALPIQLIIFTSTEKSYFTFVLVDANCHSMQKYLNGTRPPYPTMEGVERGEIPACYP